MGRYRYEVKVYFANGIQDGIGKGFAAKADALAYGAEHDHYAVMERDTSMMRTRVLATEMSAEPGAWWEGAR